MASKEEVSKNLISVLGPKGRDLSIKKRYEKYQHHVIIRTSICLPNFGEVWCGDLDLTAEEQKLRRLAKKLQVEFYLLQELDTAIDLNKNLPLNLALFKINQKKTLIHKDFFHNIKRNSKGNWWKDDNV